MDLPYDTETIDDLSALAWVQDELRRSLEAAHKAMRRYLKEAAALAGSDVDAQRRVGRARLGAGVAWNLAPLPVVRPQVGRVNSVGAGQLLHRTVLREQRQR